MAIMATATLCGCAQKSENALPKVYMTADISAEGLVKVYQALGVEATGKVAVKISTGEPGGHNYLKPELIKKVLGDEEPVTCRFADTLSDGLPAAREYLGKRATCDEDVLSYIAFPMQAEAYFEKRDELERNTFTYTIREV